MKTINAHHQALLESQVQTFCTCWWLGLNFRNPQITTIERGTVTTVICNFGHGLEVGDTCILKGVKGLIPVAEQPGSAVDALSDVNDNPHADFWRVWTVLAAPDPFTIVLNVDTESHSQYEYGGIVRKVLGYTDHLTDISMDGFTYKAELGYKPTSTETASSGSVDTVSIQGFMPRVTSDCEFNEGDILSGVYDNAELRMFLVDYDAPNQGRIWLRRGYLGEVEIGNEQYEAEVLSLVTVLSQPTLNLFSAECRHDLGDNGCRVTPSFQYSEISNEPYTNDNLAGSFIRGEVERNIFGEPFEGSPEDRFQYGRIRFLTGLNAGVERAVGRTYIDTISEILERFKEVIDYTFPLYPGSGATQPQLDQYEIDKSTYETNLFDLVVKDLDAKAGTQIVDSIPVPRIDYPPLPTNFIYMPDAIRRRDVWQDRIQSSEQAMRMGTDVDNLYGLTLPGLGEGKGGELYLLNFRENGVDLSSPLRLGNPLDGSYHYVVRRTFQQKAPCVLEDDGNNQDMVFASDIENKLFGIKNYTYRSNTHGQIKRVACNRLHSTELIHNNDVALAIDQKRPLLLVKHNPDGHYEALSDFMQYRFEIPVIVNVPALATAKSNVITNGSQTNNAQPPTDPGPVTPPDHADEFVTSRLGTAADGFGDGDFLFTPFASDPRDTIPFVSGDVIDVLVDDAWPYGETASILTHEGITKTGVEGASSSIVDEGITTSYTFLTAPWIAGDIIRIDQTNTHIRYLGTNLRDDGVTQEQVDQYVLDLLVFNASQGVEPVDPGFLNDGFQGYTAYDAILVTPTVTNGNLSSNVPLPAFGDDQEALILDLTGLDVSTISNNFSGTNSGVGFGPNPNTGPNYSILKNFDFEATTESGNATVDNNFLFRQDIEFAQSEGRNFIMIQYEGANFHTMLSGFVATIEELPPLISRTSTWADQSSSVGSAFSGAGGLLTKVGDVATMHASGTTVAAAIAALPPGGLFSLWATDEMTENDTFTMVLADGSIYDLDWTSRGPQQIVFNSLATKRMEDNFNPTGFGINSHPSGGNNGSITVFSNHSSANTKETLYEVAPSFISLGDIVTQQDIDNYQLALAAYNEYLQNQAAQAEAAENTELPTKLISKRENSNTILQPIEAAYHTELFSELTTKELYEIVVLRFDGDYVGDYSLLLEDTNGDTYRYDLCQPWNGECISAEKEGLCFRLDKLAVANGGHGVLQILDDRSPTHGGAYPNPAPLCYDHPLPFEGTIPDEPVLQGTKTLLDFNAESTGVAPQNFVDAGVPYSGTAIPNPILVNNVDVDFGDNYVQLILATGRKYFVYTGGAEIEDSVVACQVKSSTDQFNRQPSVVLRANSQRLVELRFANQFNDLELWDVAVPTGQQTIRARVDVSDIVLPDTIYQLWLRAAGNRCFFALRQTDETVLRSGEGLTLTTTGRPGVGVTVSEF